MVGFYFIFSDWMAKQKMKTRDFSRILQVVTSCTWMLFFLLVPPIFFFSFLVPKCWLQKSSHQLLSIAAHCLTYILLCLVVGVLSFLNSTSLSEKASLVFLLAGCLRFWQVLATDGVCLREAQQDPGGALCGLSLVAPFVPVVWEGRAPKWVVLAFPSCSISG